MNNVTKEILKAWYLAYKQANDNPKILMMTSLEHDFSTLCSLRMSVIFHCEKLLYSLPFNNDYPHELTRHLEAKKNESKCECGYYSIMSKKHPECIEKTREYFDSQNQLMKYIENNLIS